IVEQPDIIVISRYPPERLVIARHPVQHIPRMADLGEEIAREEVVVFVVLDQQHLYGVHVDAIALRDQKGSSTNSIQYRPITLINSIRPSKVTGLVMNELAPRS